jgi:alpha-glucosidase
MYNRLLFFCFAMSVCLSGMAQQTKPVVILSPDRSTVCEIGITGNGNFQYRVFYRKKPVVSWSAMGITVNNNPVSGKTAITRTAQKVYNEKFAWPLGEDEFIVNSCNETKLFCSYAGMPFNIIARAYNGSIAFRYELPGNAGEQITAEQTCFNLNSAYTIYQYNQESVFTPVSIDTFSNTCDLPATLTNKELYLSIGEADNSGYTKAELKRGSGPHSLQIVFPRDKRVESGPDFLTPWRTISISESAIGLHAFSQLYLKLASAPVASVPGWIKPGKLIRAQLTTQSGLECIDFAAAHQFQYIMFDAGWYGAEFRDTSDPTRTIPEIDMHKVIAYGKEKGIGVILYVNYVGLRAKLDTILPLYKKWGVAGLKFGFVDGLTQQGLRWLYAAIKKVYDHGFVLNIHDNYKPTGLSRTFPQLLTQEGIRGDENSPDAFHNTVLPFTRFLAGPADFTFCYPNTTNSYSKNIKVSKAQQLALSVVYFSPLQSVFWYGRPKEYTNEQEIEFFNYVPTVWNESHYLSGEIGRNISVARRHGDSWLIGNVAGLEDWKGTIRLDFLTKGKTYTVTIYEDDGQGGISKKQLSFKKGDKLNFSISAKGGQAIILR